MTSGLFARLSRDVTHVAGDVLSTIDDLLADGHVDILGADHRHAAHS